MLGQYGLNDSERYLSHLCQSTFLSLWSFSNLYRQPGSELCDLLVTCGDDLIVFSDKFCQYPNTGQPDLDWSRWFKRAVAKSAAQLWGAEKWIRRDPARIFLDSNCKTPLRVPLAITEKTRFHLIAIAHGSAEACRQMYGGSGSLMINTTLTSIGGHLEPFVLGDLDRSQTFIHILDDNSLNIVLQKQDTITDFAQYLNKRLGLLRGEKIIFSPGEEEMLAHYLKHLNEENEHDFVFPPTEASGYGFEEGGWLNFVDSPLYRNQAAADEVSYFWDYLIERFSHHAIHNTQHFVSEGGFADSEKAIRMLALERRLSRRALAENLKQMILTTPKHLRRIRYIPTLQANLYYTVLLLPYDEKWYKSDYNLYREFRRMMLEICVFVTRLINVNAEHIVGIAMESGVESTASSEELLYYDCDDWSDELEEQTRKDQLHFRILLSPEMMEMTFQEYPDQVRNSSS